MEFERSALDGVVIVKPRVFGDTRGFFLEVFHSEKFREAGLPASFVQDNHSMSVRGTLRGLHAQKEQPQGKLVRVIEGEIFNVAVDIREGSPSFGKWVGVELSAETKHQLWVPPGFLHGFCVTSERAQVEYKCTALYAPEDEFGVAWNDPDIGIDWPIANPLLSEKDRGLPRLAEL